MIYSTSTKATGSQNEINTMCDWFVISCQSEEIAIVWWTKPHSHSVMVWFPTTRAFEFAQLSKRQLTELLLIAADCKNSMTRRAWMRSRYSRIKRKILVTMAVMLLRTTEQWPDWWVPHQPSGRWILSTLEDFFVLLHSVWITAICSPTHERTSNSILPMLEGYGTTPWMNTILS